MRRRARTGPGVLMESPRPAAHLGPSAAPGGTPPAFQSPAAHGVGRVFRTLTSGRSATPVPGHPSLGPLLVHRGNRGEPHPDCGGGVRGITSLALVTAESGRVPCAFWPRCVQELRIK